jgi:outer membrane protein assembly factor BamA
VSVSGRYSLDFTELFNERFDENDEDAPLIDRRFPQVRLSILSTGLSWDRRNNLLSPTRGTYASGDIEVAARGIGSEVGYVKTFLSGSGFRSLNTAETLVLAGRAQVGIARGFERTVTTVDADGEKQTEIVADLPASQRFFAGGATTVRGFDVDRLGVDEILNDTSGLSSGGNGLIVLNLELRSTPWRLWNRPLGVVGFVDGGNVFAKAGEMSLAELRGAAGFGVRYDSALGPLRLDFGFKTDRRVVAGSRERGWAWHLSFGEAF